VVRNLAKAQRRTKPEPPATWHCPDCGTNFIHESEGT
jgi:hypothetical protein